MLLFRWLRYRFGMLLCWFGSHDTSDTQMNRNYQHVGVCPRCHRLINDPDPWV